MDVEEWIVSDYCIDFLSDPNLILFPMVIFLISDIDEIRQFEADNEEKVVRIRNEEIRFTQIGVLMCGFM